MARRWTIIKSYTRRRNVWLHVTLSTCARSIVKRIPGRAWVTINHDSSLNFALNRSLYSNFSNWILKKFPSKKKIIPVLKGSYKYTPCNYYLKYKILAQVTIDKLSFPKNVHNSHIHPNQQDISMPRSWPRLWPLWGRHEAIIQGTGHVIESAARRILRFAFGIRFLDRPGFSHGQVYQESGSAPR